MFLREWYLRRLARKYAENQPESGSGLPRYEGSGDAVPTLLITYPASVAHDEGIGNCEGTGHRGGGDGGSAIDGDGVDGAAAGDGGTGGGGGVDAAAAAVSNSVDGAVARNGWIGAFI